MPGPEAQEGEREPDLVVRVPLALQGRKRAGQHGCRRILRRRLGEAPGDSHHQRVEPGPPGGADRLEAQERVRHPDDGHVPEGLERGGVQRTAHQEGCRSGAHRLGEEAVPVGSLAGQGDEEVARLHRARVHRAAANRAAGVAEQRPAGRRHEVGGTQRGIGRRQGRAAARAVGRHGGHVGECRTGARHGCADAAGADAEGAGRTGGRSRVVMASVAIRRNSSNDSTAFSMSPGTLTIGLPSPMRTATTSSGAGPADEPDEREVVDVGPESARLRIPDLGGAGLAAHEVAGDQRAIPVERAPRSPPAP